MNLKEILEIERVHTKLSNEQIKYKLKKSVENSPKLNSIYEKISIETKQFNNVESIVKLKSYFKPYGGFFEFFHLGDLNFDYLNTIQHETCINTNNKTKVFFCTEQGIFQFVSNSFFNPKKFSKPYTLNDIVSLELLNDKIILSSNNSTFAKTLIGGLLFGGLGAIAGSLSKDSSNSKTKDKYSLMLRLNDIQLAAFEIKCKDRETAIKLVSTFELWEKAIVAKKIE